MPSDPDPRYLLDHLEDVRAWCLQRSGDPHLAEDVTQETALTALLHWEDLREPGRLRGWLFRIARSRLSDASRRPRELPLTMEPTAPAYRTEASELGRVKQLNRALRRLPTFLRKPVRLHYLHGHSLREVARSLCTTVNGVKSRLYRARQALKEDLP